MANLQEFKSLTELSTEQLLNFCSQELEGNYNKVQDIQLFRKDWFEEDECEEEVDIDGYFVKVPSMSQVFTHLSEHFKGPYYFKGDEYIPNLKEEEEKEVSFRSEYLPLLGSCKIFPSLKRISYWEEHVYAEDHDCPPIPHPEKIRVSFEDYLKLLTKKKEEIEQAEMLIKSLL